MPKIFSGYISFVGDIFNYAQTDKIYNNQGDVWYASARLVGMVHDGILAETDRLFSFLNWILSLFMPSQFVDKKANIVAYMQDTYRSGGGGLISTVFYTWLSYPGVILIAVYLSFLLNKVYSTKNQYLLLYSIMVLITYPRWFAYNPITMFKLCMYVVPVYFLFKHAKKIPIGAVRK